MTTRNEIKAYIIRKGKTMSQVVEKLAEEHGWSASVPNLSGKRFLRCDSLSADYSEAAICERLSGVRPAPAKQKAMRRARGSTH